VSHLQPQATHALFLVCETTGGVEMFPADLAGVEEPFPEVILAAGVDTSPVDGDMVGRMEPYLDPRWYLLSVECVRGWFARLSAPGYTDCTEWSGPFYSEEAALAYLGEMYGED
jgi:hypothetical protein